MHKHDRTQQMGVDSIGTLLLRFSIPAITGMVVNASYNVVDRIFIGRGVGSLGIAGITVGFPMMLVMMAFSMLIGLGGAALISLKLGEQKRDEAETALGNGVLLLAINALAITIVGLLFLDPLLRLFGASDDVLPYSRDYMAIIIGGAVFHSLSFGANAYIRAEGNPRIAMATMLIGAGLNAILAPIFIFLFKWGMRGAGLATVSAQMVSAVWVISYFLRGRSSLTLKRVNMTLRKDIILKILTIGSAPFAMQIANSILMIILNHSLEHYGGDIAISAMGIVFAISLMIMMPIFGINQGAQPIIGYNYGARRFDRVLETLKIAIFAATSIVLAGYFIAQVFPSAIIRLFNSDDKQLIETGVYALRVYLIFLPIVGFQVVCSSYFFAIGKPAFSMFLTLSRQVIFLLPALLILPRFYNLHGVFMAGPTADLISSVVTAVFILMEIRTLKRFHQMNMPDTQSN